MSNDKIILEARNINKRFPGVQALSDVSIEVRKGEVHALVGENGAGKSTLMKILAGEYQPDEGEILVNGQKAVMHSPSDALACGLGLVHQHFPLALDLTVTENVFMDREILKKNGRMIDWTATHAKAHEFLVGLGVDIDEYSIVRNLPVGQRQMIEIAKSISRQTKIIILDEPTSALHESEIEYLFKMINKLKKKGVSFIFISHKLEEVFNICDRVTVLRDGKKVSTKNIRENSGEKPVAKDELIRMMIGRKLDELYPYKQGEVGKPLLSVKGLNFKGKLVDIEFEVHSGEILGITGLSGSGLDHLAKNLFGMSKPNAGSINLDGREISGLEPSITIKEGIMLVPDDRRKQGLCLGLSVRENLILSSLDRISRGSVVLKKMEKKHAADLKRGMGVVSSSMDMAVGNLSGGNQQKVLIGKAIGTQPKVLILNGPTIGIDVGSKTEIYKVLMNLARKEKISIIILSEEIPEVLGICDRILVLEKGRIRGEFLRENANQELLHKVVNGL